LFWYSGLRWRNAMQAAGLVTIPSKFGAHETLDRLKAELKARGFDLFSEIDHAKNAADAALTLSPCTLLIFGNAKTGTALMEANPAVGIDLPLKALVWADASGAVAVSYNDPVWIAKRHRLAPGLLELAEKMRGGLEALAAAAAGG
jgi:uncharacterized protein (DUF302 family)